MFFLLLSLWDTLCHLAAGVNVSNNVRDSNLHWPDGQLVSGVPTLERPCRGSGRERSTLGEYPDHVVCAKEKFDMYEIIKFKNFQTLVKMQFEFVLNNWESN